MTIESRVHDIIREQFGANPDLTTETTFINDLGCDSLDAVELIIELEEEFNIAIPDADINDGSDKTVGEVVAYIERRVAPPQAPTMFSE